MSTHAIEIRNLWKTYPLYLRPLDRLKEAIHPLRKLYHHDFNALQDVSFSVERGKTVGIVGKNGSGKSTLLKIISGVLQASRGEVDVRGRVSALLELGTGFNPELSGYENIQFSGIVMGMTVEQIRSKEDEIISFADIGEFIHQPVKTYSSGMYVRLAFAVATCIEPEILIVDEALAVGDMYFQAKSMKRMKMLMEQGCTTVFVSHDIHSIKSLCSEVLYLKDGQTVEFGNAADVCDRYVRDQLDKGGFFPGTETAGAQPTRPGAIPLAQPDLEEFESRVSLYRKGSGEIRILLVQTLQESGVIANTFIYGEKIRMRAFLRASQGVDEVVCAFYVRDKNQVEVVGTNTVYEGEAIRAVRKDSLWVIEFELPNYLKSGNYSVQILLADSLATTAYFDWIEIATVFRVNDLPGRTRWAMYNPPMRCTVQQMESQE